MAWAYDFKEPTLPPPSRGKDRRNMNVLLPYKYIL